MHEGFKLEVDEYFGALEGLFTLECEFKSIVEANNFKLPEWAKDACDVTIDKRFKNKILALEGRPR